MYFPKMLSKTVCLRIQEGNGEWELSEGLPDAVEWKISFERWLYESEAGQIRV